RPPNSRRRPRSIENSAVSPAPAALRHAVAGFPSSASPDADPGAADDAIAVAGGGFAVAGGSSSSVRLSSKTVPLPPAAAVTVTSRNPRSRSSPRSEEHTSELQSPYDLVCRLLLEKKK